MALSAQGAEAALPGLQVPRVGEEGDKGLQVPTHIPYEMGSQLQLPMKFPNHLVVSEEEMVDSWDFPRIFMGFEVDL